MLQKGFVRQAGRDLKNMNSIVTNPPYEPITNEK